MKKILAMAAVAALAAGASAYAANPFSDVSTSDWAYQAISDLSDRGLIDGYPDGTFKGQQNITRYEVAQIVARLMAKEDQMNAETRAIVDRLASEYSAELQNLGVRVGNLEKKVGNIAWSGDARVRYQKANGSEDKFNGRIRLNARATVNDTTYVHGRLAATGDFKEGSDANVKMDRIYVHHQFGKVGATLGRYELDLGQQLGGWLYANAFDGIEVAAPLGEKVNLAIGYGRMKDAAPDKQYKYDGETYNYTAVNYAGGKYGLANDFKKSEIFYAQLKADFKTVKVGIDYFRAAPYRVGGFNLSGAPVSILADGSIYKDQKKSVWGVNVLVPINNFRVFADYYADTQTSKFYSDANIYGKDQKGKIWTVGLGYGAKDLQKAGTFNLDLAYFKVNAGLYEAGMTGAQAPSIDRLFMENGRFWLASGDVVVAKNTYVHGEYAFGAKASEKGKTDEYGNSWTLSLNYKF